MKQLETDSSIIVNSQRILFSRNVIWSFEFSLKRRISFRMINKLKMVMRANGTTVISKPYTSSMTKFTSLYLGFLIQYFFVEPSMGSCGTEEVDDPLVLGCLLCDTWWLYTPLSIGLYKLTSAPKTCTNMMSIRAKCLVQIIRLCNGRHTAMYLSIVNTTIRYTLMNRNV